MLELDFLDQRWQVQSMVVFLPTLTCSRHLTLNPALLPSELTLDPTSSPNRALQADIANLLSLCA